MQNLWRDAQDALIDVRLLGDLVLAAFFEGSKPKERESRRRAYQEAILNREPRRHAAELEERRHAEMPFVPFHWEIEFPEVFERESPGFDGFVGNPPFAGKNSVAAGNVTGYPSWLKEMHEESHGNADLVAHFYRRAFSLVRDGGTLGLIATNTIAQGDTRSTGLRWICEHGGEIYCATKRVKWPGDAAVIVSVLHVVRGEYAGNRVLRWQNGGPDHRVPVPSRRPRRSSTARGLIPARASVGSYVLGMGFTFDDTDKKGVASRLAEMQRLIDSDPRNRQVIFPYIGGEEVNTSPTHAHHRYVINFAERSEAECRRRWPDLMAIVEQRVKPERLKLGDNGDARRRKARWWLWGRYTPALFAVTGGLEKLLAISRIGNSFAFTFLPAGRIYNEKVVVFPVHNSSTICGSPVPCSRDIGRGLLAPLLKTTCNTHPRIVSRPSRFPKDGKPIQPSNRPARSTTSSAPRSWSITTRA